MKHLFVILISLFFSATLYSRNKIINLDNQKLNIALGKYRIDSVIDARPDKTSLGYVYKGLRNRKVPVYLEAPLTSYLNTLFIYNNTPIENAEHIIIRVNKLFVYETLYQNIEYSHCEINVSFISKKDNKLIEKFESSALITNESGFDATIKLKKNIVEALNSSVYQSTKRNSTGKLEESKEIRPSELGKNPLNSPPSYKVLNVDHFPKGIYRTFADFRDYTPDTSANFTVEYKIKKDSIKHTYIRDIHGNLVDNIWGFSNDSINFIRTGLSYQPLTKEDNIFTLKHTPPDYIARVLSSYSYGGLLFSIIMAHSIKKIKYKLDLSISGILPFDYTKTSEFKSDIVLLSSEYNSPDTKLKVIANGIEQCILPTGAYTVLSFNSSTSKAQIEITQGKKIDNITSILFYLQQIYTSSDTTTEKLEFIDLGKECQWTSSIK